ncbi:MAG TPA: NAD(P)-dependent oxidoreductase [Gemmatimonas sp.]|nr:NAD(P)-dependent oxidoreductase [Gemmatimonas sp.]
MQLTILSPKDAAELVPALPDSLNPMVWVYRCHDERRGWTLSAATHAEPGSGKLSLGGFRIAPLDRMAAAGFSTEREAVALAMGMEAKVQWSRVLRIGGPLGRRESKRMVGGKCVVAPTPGARVGEPQDAELLDFSIECFEAIEAEGGFHLTTGQDMGHGTMHDGVTTSLQYLNERFAGSAIADTSVPTGEGNFQLLTGMLRGHDIDVRTATVGLIGCGKVGTRVLERLREIDANVLVFERHEPRRLELEAMGVRTWTFPAGVRAASDDGIDAFLAQPMDALVVNGSGGSLDEIAVEACCANLVMKVVCGSENLVMTDTSLANLLQQSDKSFAPTELGGMMGYLTAAEEYLSRRAGVTFDPDTLIAAAADLEQAGFDAVKLARDSGGALSFAEAVRHLEPSSGREIRR